MPGIVGFTCRKLSIPDPISVLCKMTDLLRHFQDYVDDTSFCQDNIFVSRTQTKPLYKDVQPCVHDDLYVWLDGEFYNQNELSLAGNLKDQSDAMILAQNIRMSGGFEFLKNIDGIYAAVIYDERKQRIHLINDRYGLGRLFWTVIDGDLVWSTESKGFLAHPSFSIKINDEALQGYFNGSLSYLRGDSSWFHGVELLSPATVLSWYLKDGTWAKKNYWSWNEIKFIPENSDPRQIVDELGRRFLRAVEKRCHNGVRVGLQLSGGLDSRAILAAMPVHKGNVHALTFGEPDCEDIRFSAMAASVAGARHHILELDEDNWLDGHVDAIWYTDGELNFLYSHIMRCLPLMKRLFEINLSGYLGDATIGGTYIDLHGIDEKEHFIDRGRRFIRLGDRLTDVFLHARIPFFDNDFIDLALALPPSWRRGSVIYNKMLLKSFPEYFGSIPWQSTGEPISVAPVVAAKSPRRPKNPSFHRTHEWLRVGKGRAIVEQVLRNQTALYPDFVSRENVMAEWERHLCGEDHGDMIGRYLTLEVWLQQVFEKRYRPVPG